MKNKKSNLIKYIILVLLLITLIFLLIFFLQKNNNVTIQKIGEKGYSIDISETISRETSKITDNPNAPQLGAGMIPIKYVDGNWQITTTDDTDWYDYSNGKFATVMLSNGKYVSEERYNMGEHKLVPEGNKTQVSQEDLGTIFVWIPRLVYTDDQIMYLNGTSIVETENATLQKCFTYKIKNSPEYALSGIWIEQTPFDTKEMVASEIPEMTTEENDYGLIKNEVIENIDKYANKVVKRIQTESGNNEQQVKDINNTNRVMLRIVNTNVNTPIIVNAHTAGKKAYIDVIYSDKPIKEIISVDNGTTLSEYSNQAVMDTQENGTYTFAIIDIDGNIKIETVQVGDGTPDLKGVKVNTTFIVLYDVDGNEYSDIPLKDILKDGFEVNKENTLIKGNLDFKKIAQIEKEYNAIWYNYEEQKWANIVVRNNANEAYWVWIPRYVYKLNEAEQSTDVIFVNLDNEPSNGEDITDYILPDAFIWLDEDGEEVQIPGYWIGKYALSSAIDFNLTVEIIGGMNEIKVNNISCNLSDTTYDVYLYNSDVDINKVEDGDELELAQNKTSYTFKNVPKGDYKIEIVVKDSLGNYRAEKWFDASVIDAGIPELPDFAGCKVDTTYLVVYAEDGTQDESIPISRILSDGYQLLDTDANTLKVGNVDENKVKAVLEELNNATGKEFVWYNYEEQKWANIVIKNNGKTAYWVWIPRYVYKLDNTNQATEILFLSPNDETPAGWTLPDAFSWVGTDKDGNTVTKPLNGYWIGKYVLSN